MVEGASGKYGGLMESKPQGEQPSGWMSTLKKRHGHMARAPINGEIARRHIELWSKKSMSANVRKGDFQTNLRLAPGSMYIINTPNDPVGVSIRVLCMLKKRQNVETNLRHPCLNPKTKKGESVEICISYRQRNIANTC